MQQYKITSTKSQQMSSIVLEVSWRQLLTWGPLLHDPPHFKWNCKGLEFAKIFSYFAGNCYWSKFFAAKLFFPMVYAPVCTVGLLLCFSTSRLIFSCWFLIIDAICFFSLGMCGIDKCHTLVFKINILRYN